MLYYNCTKCINCIDTVGSLDTVVITAKAKYVIVYMCDSLYV